MAFTGREPPSARFDALHRETASDLFAQEIASLPARRRRARCGIGRQLAAFRRRANFGAVGLLAPIGWPVVRSTRRRRREVVLDGA
jgi:hypothetical protein